MDTTLQSLQETIRQHLDEIHAYCTAHKKTIAVAESVTAGCIQFLLSTTTGAQDFLQGGITAYNCSQKTLHLGIDPVFADNCNGVDERIAFEMAKNACQLFRSQIGIGITGYASRVPEEGIEELYAYLAIVKDGDAICQVKLSPQEEGITAQWDYASAAIHKLSGALK